MAKKDGDEVKRLLKPQLDGDYWMIGDNPEVIELTEYDELTGEFTQHCVDHHIFRSEDGKWNLWGCIRGLKNGRILYHWQGDSLTDRHWHQTGEIIRADRSYGESIDDWYDKEYIQSPYVVKENGKYYMFYGGHTTGMDYEGNPITAYGGNIDLLYTNSICQMCLMTSLDGIHWERHENENGKSNVFEGPGEVRDPCLLKIGGTWYMYYAGCHKEEDKVVPGIYARKSEDLINWSEYRLVHSDVRRRFGGEFWNQECPHVVERGGYYYLFTTQDYASGRTHVFRSEDMLDFGVGDSMKYYVGMIYAAAPEIIVDADGSEYITSNHYLLGGTMLSHLKWIEV